MKKKIYYLSLVFVFSAQIAKAMLPEEAVTNHIIFNNKTPYSITSTASPYLDNFSYLSSRNYTFTKPSDVIFTNNMTKAKVSYNWHYNWYGVSQFAYNYEGRSKEYGCFVTEIRLSWRWGGSYYIVISSYRQDPNYPDDYLICHVTKKADSNNHFQINFSSSKDASEKRDTELDDTNRYDIAGDGYELAKTSYFYLNKPLPLNPTLTLYPNQLNPEKSKDVFNSIDSNSDYYYEITVVNHASAPVVAGPRLLDVFSQFSDKYYFNQPENILPDNEAKVKIGLPDYLIFSYSGWGGSNFSLQQFSYHFNGYAKNSGCFITFSNKIWNTPVTSFYFDPLHSNNLYCLVTAKNTVEIYDDPSQIQLSAAGCVNNDLKTCVSVSISNFDSPSLKRFYKNGDDAGESFSPPLASHYYSKLPLSSDSEKNYIIIHSPLTPTIPYPYNY